MASVIEAVTDEIFDAIDKVQRILSNKRGNRREDHAYLVRICAKYPRLVTFRVHIDDVAQDINEWSMHKEHFREWSPLLYLIRNRASWELMLSFFDTHHAIIQDPTFLRAHNPLHFACLNYKDLGPNVLSILVKHCSTDARRPLGESSRLVGKLERGDLWSPGLPLFLLLEKMQTNIQRGPPDSEDLYSKDLKVLYEATFPNGLGSIEDVNDRICLGQKILDLTLGPRTPHYAITCIIDQLSELKLDVAGALFHCILTLNYAKAITTLVATKRMERLCVTLRRGATKEACLLLFSSLRHCPSLERLRLNLSDDFGLTNAVVDVATFKELKISLMSMAQSIKVLTLIGPKGLNSQATNLTEIVVKLVNNNKLETLVLQGSISVDPKPLFEALKHNTSLETLRVRDCTANDSYELLNGLVSTLSQNNTTLFLAEVWPLSTKMHDPKRYKKIIEYLTELNVLGRVKLRDPDTTFEHFMTLLKASMDYAYSEVYMYGILRENPGKWCTKIHEVFPTKISLRKQPQLGQKRTHSQIL